MNRDEALQRAREYRVKIVNAARHLPDAEALESVELFDEWNPDHGRYYDGNDGEHPVDRVRRFGLLYKCVQTHDAQDNWSPERAVSLWTRIAEPSEWPEWIQPTGAHNAYAKDAKVSHNGKHWISDIPNNVYEPGVYGWTVG